MTIKGKILIPMIALTVVSALAILISNIVLFSNNVDANIREEVSIASAVAEEKLESLKDEARIASLYMAEDGAIANAIMAGNRDALLARLKQMQNETGVEFSTVMDTTGTVLARAHEPDNYGDSLASQTNVKSAMAGTGLTTIEKGSAVRLSVRSGSPIYDPQGTLIGVVSVGYRLDTAGFVDGIKATLNCEVTVFLEDERISTTLTDEKGDRVIGTRAVEDISQKVLAGRVHEGEANLLGREALAKYTPIYGVDGKALGMLFVGRYSDEKTQTVLEFVRADFIIMLLLLVLFVPLILLLVTRIVTPIKAMVDAAHALAEGDTEISVHVASKDEMRLLADAFNEMIENSRMQTQTIGIIAEGDLTMEVKPRSKKDHMNLALESMLERNNRVFSQIVGSAAQTTNGAQQMADSSQSLARGASEQAAAVDELSGIIGQVETNTAENAAMASKASNLAEQIKRYAETGSGQMEQMVQAVKEINDASQSISKIIKVIDDIASQTNILALNAAVEAARAGQHGRGFAVVAEEVRSLAAKSGEAVKDTAEIVENSIKKAQLGVRIAAETSASLSDIVVGINQSSKIVGEIASSSLQQRDAIAQINSGISQVAQVVQQNSSAAEESAALSQQMSHQAELLQRIVAQFKLNNQQGGQIEQFMLTPSVGYAHIS